ncbi:MAG: post-COAP-1 domain-containing protein [Gaiellaceae bacterium]
MKPRLLSALVLLALIVPAAAGAQTAPSLDGEMLNGGANPPFSGAIEIDCNAAGTSTASYSMAGAAIGPLFPGTFTETGTFSIEDGQVTAFEATFTIQSGLTEINGTKTLSGTISGFCVEPPDENVVADTGIIVNTTYEATISSPLGTFADSGRAPAAVNMTLFEGGGGVGSMQETFISEGPVPTAGHVTGGGYIGDVLHSWVSFGFNAKSDGTTVKAQCNVKDHATGTHVKCQNATLLAQTPTHATFLGQAHVNGVLTNYRIDVDDLGEPGAGRDTFKIVTDSGFAAAGVLRGGNIQIHD